ncbi:guanylate-binding protein [Achlya hypogyna]|uniref:Guanylate-binding protein n=1 Tax=Achlya hypogyna TaxID=1202772 RepID=A0A1V9YPT8_ACHHY|nr:guanylate-binding protein [Achlya hypogyna]
MGKKTTRRSSSASDDALTQFPDEPIALLHFDEKEDRLQVNEQAMEILQKIEGKISVVAMAGLYRTGKSSMLNWLLGNQSGFRVGPTVERCTRGIWLWGRPQKHPMSNGEDCYVLMLDTEGLGGLEASAQYDVRIFSLATLLCSKLIYNSQGSVDEKAVNGLSFIANMTKHIRIRADASGDDAEGEEFSNFFPSFTWVVRDFTLELVDEDGDPITPNEYLERALAPQPGLTQAVMERNRVRHMMTSFFKDRDCYTMVRPVYDENQLQQVDRIPISELRAEFQDQLAKLKQSIFGNLQPKMLNNKPLNGSMFAGLLVAYVDAINNGSVPTISSAWDGVTATECKKAMKSATEAFRVSLSLLEMPLDPDDLSKALKDAEVAAVAQYKRQAMGDAAAKYEAELLEKIEEEKATVRKQNRAVSKDTCDRLLQTLFSELIQPRFSDEKNSYEDMQDFAREWVKFRERYLEQAKGGAKLDCLLAFSETKHADAMRLLLSRQEDKFEKKIRSLEAEAAAVKETLGAIGGREQVYKQQIEALQHETSEVMSERAKYTAEVEAQQHTIEQLKAKLAQEAQGKHQIDVEKEQIALQLDTIRGHKDEKENELEKMRRDYERLMKEKERTDLELSMAAGEVEQLKHGQKCGCTIQ